VSGNRSETANIAASSQHLIRIDILRGVAIILVIPPSEWYFWFGSSGISGPFFKSRRLVSLMVVFYAIGFWLDGRRFIFSNQWLRDPQKFFNFGGSIFLVSIFLGAFGGYIQSI
jgi:hypothetical protein